LIELGAKRLGGRTKRMSYLHGKICFNKDQDNGKPVLIRNRIMKNSVLMRLPPCLPKFSKPLEMDPLSILTTQSS
jgi:hypothetical protein